MPDYKMTIGLEIHAEVKTASKMFCGCKNDPDEKRPNVNVCPICFGHPGTLPVINKEAVRKILQVGVAVGGTIADFSEFDRKNYFYPDIPKNYQISQYKYPLVSGGSLAGVELTRIHLEEDTARSSHETGDTSLVDYNRAGVPLMELVTEPVIHSAEEAMKFGKELQLLLQYLGVSEANMEKGEMRVEVNISISNTDERGTKVEVKNINSFRSAGRAIEYEFKRQKELLEKGEKVVQETRGFNEDNGTTFSQRSKEDSHDYRYFPDPDLPKLKLSEILEFSLTTISASLKETPESLRKRYRESFGITDEQIETLINQRVLREFFEQAVMSLPEKNDKAYKTTANYVTSDIAGLMSETDGGSVMTRISPQSFAELVGMVISGELSSRGAKDTLKIMSLEGGNAKQVVEKAGLIQKSDPEELRMLLESIISQNLDKVEEYKNGKLTIVEFFIGQGMKATKGSGNPEVIRSIVLNLISKNS